MGRVKKDYYTILANVCEGNDLKYGFIKMAKRE